MAEANKAQHCPRCNQLADVFHPIDSAVRTALNEAGINESFPDEVCPVCYEQLTSHVSQGLKLRLERDGREKNKMVMWKNRVNLIKNARGLMNQKAYSEAAVQYEKYLRVLEMVYNLKKGELSPAVFNNSSRSKELTVIASVYWDLVRIYDTNPRYGDRMQTSAAKLSAFLPFSPIYPDIIKKAEQFSRSCKNPKVLTAFLKNTKAKRGPCFIATAAFAEEPFAPELHILREFRDQRLRPYYLGRQFVWIYYRTSPPVAAWIRGSQLKTRAARWLVTKIASGLKKSLNSR
jgi:hypothetical protein